MRLIDLFDKGAELDPQRPFLIDDDGEHSFAEVQRQSHRIAAALLDAGIRPGAKVAVWSHNSARAMICVLGALRAGCVWTPVSPYNVAEEAIYQLDHAEVEVLFYCSSTRKSLPTVRARCPKMRLVIAIDEPDADGLFLDQWTAKWGDEQVDLPYAPDDLTLIMYTGGTTGKQKGVMHSHRSCEAVARNFSLNIGWDRPVFLVTAPISHAAGTIVLTTAHMGATNVVLPRFEPQRVLQAIERYRVTHLFLPPTAIYMLLAQPDVRSYDYSSLRRFLYAASIMFVDKLKEAVETFGPVMCQSYALAEILPNLTFLPAEEHDLCGSPAAESRLKSAGRPIAFARVEIMDDDGKILGRNELGEVCAQSSTMMEGYYKEPQLTAETIRDGWLHTGDIGYRDDDGYLFIVDRKKDMIVTGGFNVYPSEIEQVLSRHPSVLDCAVIGVPDEKWGEAVKGVVELRPGANATADELTAHCSKYLNSTKIPKSFDFRTELPRSAVGKVLKRTLRSPYWDKRERSI